MSQTDCKTSTACNGQDTRVTTTPGSPQCTLDPNDAAANSAADASDYTVINGKQVPLQLVVPTNPPGFDPGSFTKTQFGLQETVVVVTTKTVTAETPTSTTVQVPPTAKADCASW